MKRKKGPPKDEPTGAPGWIVSYSDMVTLLLSFFVLLQTFAKNRDPELFYQGQGSFQRAIDGLGIPDWLFGKQDHARFNFAKMRHAMPDDRDDPSRAREVNFRDETIRAKFDDLKKNLQHQTTDVMEEVLSVEVTPIRFTGPDLALTAEGQEFLNRFTRNLKQNLSGIRISVYVIGLALDTPEGKGRWVMSARRAMAVDRAMRKAMDAVFPPGTWSLDSWGAGAGKQWCERLRVGTVSPQTPILIAVMGPGGEHGGR